MFLMGDRATNAAADAPHATDRVWDFPQAYQFVPQELIGKCTALIESYHHMHGFGGLPDMLWLSDARHLIERDHDLTRLFKRASRSRGAKRANDAFLLIATVVLSLEILARDFANWGERFPAAKREAETALGDFSARQNSGLMDAYLYPSSGPRRELADAPDPSAAAPAKP
jgi:hypothetical protein